MITSFHDLHQLIKDRPARRVVLVSAEDPVLLEAAARAQAEGLAEFILMGSAPRINQLLQAIDQHFQVVESLSPAQDAIQLIRSGQADLLMKGKIPTGVLLKAVLDKDQGLRQGALINHIAAVESPHYHKLIFISDGGINLQLNEQVFEQMIRNNAAYLGHLGIQTPKFAMLSLVESVDPKIPETVIAKNVVDALKSEFLIEGPMAPDVALSAEAARQKGQDSVIAGDVDVFMMPNTTAANHLVKGLLTLGGCLGGGVVVGASVPIILLSRSDDAETRYRSILLGLVKKTE